MDLFSFIHKDFYGNHLKKPKIDFCVSELIISKKYKKNMRKDLLKDFSLYRKFLSMYQNK